MRGLQVHPELGRVLEVLRNRRADSGVTPRLPRTNSLTRLRGYVERGQGRPESAAAVRETPPAGLARDALRFEILAAWL